MDEKANQDRWQREQPDTYFYLNCPAALFNEGMIYHILPTWYVAAADRACHTQLYRQIVSRRF